MAVKVREYRRRGKPMGCWEADVRLPLPSGEFYRERVRVPVSGKTSAKRWADAREAEVISLARSGLDAEAIHAKLNGKGAANEARVPTLAEFEKQFIEHARANRQKASTVYAKESILRVHLVPVLGTKRLDEITEADVQALKVTLAEHRPKTVNNVLATLSKLLRVAKRLGVIDAVPVESFELVKAPLAAVPFYTFEEYAVLVAAARRLDPRILAAVLLGGNAGLRAGEVVALELPDVRRANARITIERQAWRGVVDTPKGGKGRVVPMTDALKAALAAVRHLRGARVLVQDDGSDLTAKVLRGWMKSAQRLAGLRPTGNFHILRHTFCSHLAMRGAPAKVIQELAGHTHLSTTMRYMHLAEGHKEQAIRLLDDRPVTAPAAGVEARLEAVEG
ncbi:integrase family protein [Anaeromyxobacter dehalogenans 2CP-1]|uniref:Integrase family protein n=1 Tax=Anaeromyxobacter dehalogenans (strain ATCC BAA-258 / DSM 21875 / 2CP-1) TaxID=455488 RepID=B8J6Q5_ANAD2|nr:site-specific integrase [Anaeromyxobacter dehalogenans]ACL67027.1 integrase family protein [Anaeromyxobacter dehalogenans 2CP-1]